MIKNLDLWFSLICYSKIFKKLCISYYFFRWLVVTSHQGRGDRKWRWRWRWGRGKWRGRCISRRFSRSKLWRSKFQCRNFFLYLTLFPLERTDALCWYLNLFIPKMCLNHFQLFLWISPLILLIPVCISIVLLLILKKYSETSSLKLPSLLSILWLLVGRV